jgi:hypothetical protein
MHQLESKFYWPRDIIKKFIDYGFRLRRPRAKTLREVREEGTPEDIKNEEERLNSESYNLEKFLNKIGTDSEFIHPRSFSAKRGQESKKFDELPTSAIPQLGSGYYGEVYLIDYDCRKSKDLRVTFLDPTSPEGKKRMAEGNVSVLKLLQTRFSQSQDFRPHYSFIMEGIICLLLGTAFPDIVIDWLDICRTTSSPPDLGLVMGYMPKTLNHFLWDDPDSADCATTYRMFWHVADNLEKLQQYFQFEHKDFRSCNIMYKKKENPSGDKSPSTSTSSSGSSSSSTSSASTPSWEIRFADFGRSSMRWDGLVWSAVPGSSFYEFYRSESGKSAPNKGDSDEDEPENFSIPGPGSFFRHGSLDPSADLAMFFSEIYLEICGRHRSLSVREAQHPGDKDRIMKKLAYLRPLLKETFLRGINLENPRDEFFKMKQVGKYKEEVSQRMKPLQYISCQIMKRSKRDAFYSTPKYVKAKLEEEIFRLQKQQGL